MVDVLIYIFMIQVHHKKCKEIYLIVHFFLNGLWFDYIWAFSEFYIDVSKDDISKL